MTHPKVQRIAEQVADLLDAHEDEVPEAEAPLPVEEGEDDPEAVLGQLYAIATGAAGKASMGERLKASELYLAYRLGKPGQAEAPGGGEMSHEEALALLGPATPSPFEDLMGRLAQLNARQQAESPVAEPMTGTPLPDTAAPAAGVSDATPEPEGTSTRADLSWPAYSKPPEPTRSGWSSYNDGLTARESPFP